MRTHPAEVNEALGLAHARCNKLVEEAERRGDQVGADAWLGALRSIETAEKEMQRARKKQTWKTVAGQRAWTTLEYRALADGDPLGRTAERERIKADSQRPPYNVACPTCGAPVGYPCQFSQAERHAPNETIHVARANRIGADLKPRQPGCTCLGACRCEFKSFACDQGTPGCRGRGDKHACISRLP